MAKRVVDKNEERGMVAPPKAGVLPIDKLTPNLANPRKHGKQQIRAIASSITAFGFNAPILIDSGHKIIAGHGRYEAAKLLRLPQVPVIFLDHLTELQAKAYLLADNKLSDRSSWDDRLVATQLKELADLALDFEIEAIGFEPPELDFRIQSLDANDSADDVHEFIVAVGPAVSAPGDVWHLGDHRILCGNSLDHASFSTLMKEERASGVFTDSPYNVPIDGFVGGKGNIKHREFAMASGEMSEQEFTDFLASSFQLLQQHSTPGALIYACMDWRNLQPMLTAGKSAQFEMLSLCVWAKNNGGMGALYRSRHELVFVFRNGSHPHQNNVQLGRFGRNRTTVWNYPGANGFSRDGARLLELHPTVKPIALVADAITDSTRRGEIILDPFLGSGTTLLAAERTGRRCYGIEIDPLYIDTAVERWQRVTGQEARTPDGISFAAVRASKSGAA